MKFKLLSFIGSVTILSSLCYGCVQSRAPETPPPPARTTINEEAAATVTILKPPCTFSFTKNSKGYLQKGSLKVTGGDCTSSESDVMYVGDTMSGVSKKVTSMSPDEFKTEGSCRYCYYNSVGGMSCVTYSSGC